MLNRFGMQPPGYLSNIGTQIKDMDIRMSPEADKSMSLKNAWGSDDGEKYRISSDQRQRRTAGRI